MESDENFRNFSAPLVAESYDVAVATTGEDGYFRATTEPFDAVLLDIGLTGSGLLFNFGTNLAPTYTAHLGFVGIRYRF